MKEKLTTGQILTFIAMTILGIIALVKLIT